MREPNLVIIGAQKSGTTSLYHYLKSHPDIFMSHPVKEPGYFMNEEFVLRLFRRIDKPVESRQEALERYMLSGCRDQRYFGEASTYYTIAKHSEVNAVPARMKQANPAMKLIYILRNPFERIVSNYLHALHTDRFRGTFKEFFHTHHYTRGLLTSRYWHQLSPYLEHFPRDQIKLVLFEDLVADPWEVMNDIYGFLELEPIGKGGTTVHNQSRNRESFAAGELLFPPRLYRQAARVIRRDVKELERLMGRDLDIWDLSKETWCTGTAGRRAARPHSVSAGRRAERHDSKGTESPRVFFVSKPSPRGKRPVDFKEAMRQTGGNTGNMFFMDALQRQLSHGTSSFGHLRDVDRAGEHYDYIAIAAANWLSGRVRFIGKLGNRIERSGLPCLVAGLGAQSLNTEEIPNLEGDTLSFLRVIAERCRVIGVRGEYTARVMEHYGIRNISVIGCPSYFWALQPTLEVRKRETKRPAVAVNASRKRVISADLNAKKQELERQLYRYAFREDGCFMVAQSEEFEISMSLGAELKGMPSEFMGSFREFYDADVTEGELENLRDRFKVFTTITEWLDQLAGVDFVIGTRLHGCLMGLVAGIPSLLITIDSRTRELADLLQIPSIALEDVALPLDIPGIYERLDLSGTLSEYPRRFRIYREFLEANGVEHNLAPEQDIGLAMERS